MRADDFKRGQEKMKRKEPGWCLLAKSWRKFGERENRSFRAKGEIP